MSYPPVEVVVWWLTSVAQVATAVGLWLLWRQLKLQRKQFEQDHERSRLEITLNVMRDWLRCVDRSTNVITRFADALDRDQAEALAREKRFKISAEKAEFLDLIAVALGLQADGVAEGGAGVHELTQQAVSLIRAQCVNYLNNLELSLTAWLHNIGDREILESEFRPLYDPSRGDLMLESFRLAIGAGFPAIEAFVSHLKQARSAHAKPPLGR